MVFWHIATSFAPHHNTDHASFCGDRQLCQTSSSHTKKTLLDSNSISGHQKKPTCKILFPHILWLESNSWLKIMNCGLIAACAFPLFVRWTMQPTEPSLGTRFTTTEPSRRRWLAWLCCSTWQRSDNTTRICNATSPSPEPCGAGSEKNLAD